MLDIIKIFKFISEDYLIHINSHYFWYANIQNTNDRQKNKSII